MVPFWSSGATLSRGRHEFDLRESSSVEEVFENMKIDGDGMENIIPKATGYRFKRRQ
jgi:hypothetical protein